VLVAVGLWVFLPNEPEAKAAAGVAEQVRRDVRHELPPPDDVILEHVVAPTAPPPVSSDAGTTVDATFKVVTDGGRIAGTRITLKNDGGFTLSSLADNFGLAHIDVTPGTWRVSCSNDCRERLVAIGPQSALYTLEVHHWLTVSGVVVDPAGRPVTGATIEEELDDRQEQERRALKYRIIEESWDEAHWYTVAHTQSDSDGRFSFQTEENRHVLFAKRGTSASPTIAVGPPQTDLRFVLFSYAYATFTIRGADPYSQASLSSTVAGMPFRARIQPRRKVALPVGNHQAVVVQRVGEQLYSAKAAFTVTPDGPNRFDVVLAPAHWLQLTVVDSNGTPVQGAQVTASSRPVDSDMFPEAVQRRLWPDGGGPPVPGPDAVGFTAGDGTIELQPRAVAEGLYEIELRGAWTLADRQMMRLGDDPVTIVAVPR
jgi:protocatechuate 3,4-dioxygenase beta subunit